MSENAVAIIILNFNGLVDTIQCIESIHTNVSEGSYEIIVVDNASKDNDADILEEKYGESIILLRSSQNVGYAAGNNIGLRYAALQGIRYFCILNNDTIVSEDFLPSFIQYLDLHKDVAFVGPALVDTKMRVQCTGRRIKRLKVSTYNINAGIDYVDLEKSEIPCDMLIGACLMFTKETLDLIGYLPEVYFLCFEETEWCVKAKKFGKTIVCIPSHYIIHKGSVSINKVNGLIEYLIIRNRVIFAKRTLSLPLFFCFLFYDTCRLVYQSKRQGTKLKKLLRYQHDGLTGHIDERFSFIWVNEK